MTRLEKFGTYGILDEAWFDALVDDYARRLQVPVTYTIFEQDDVVYADHALGTGSDFSQDDGYIHTLLQAVFDALETDDKTGGKVLVKAAKNPYIVNAEVAVAVTNKGVHLIGESCGWNEGYSKTMGAVLKAGVDMANKWIVKFIAQWAWVENIGFDGKNNTSYGVQLAGWDSKLINCAISWCTVGAHLANSNAWAYHNWIEYNNVYPLWLGSFYRQQWLIDNMFYNPSASLDIRCESALDASPQTTLHLRGNRFTESGIGIQQVGTLKWLLASGNTFHECDPKCYDITGTIKNLRVRDDSVEGNSVTANFIKVGASGVIEDGLVTGGSIENLTGAVLDYDGGASIKLKFKDVRGVNPMGDIANPFKDAAPFGVGMMGTNAAPTASRLYIVTGVDLFIKAGVQTGGTVKIYSPNDTELMDLGAAGFDAVFLPVDYKINFGAFTVAPTVTVSGN